MAEAEELRTLFSSADLTEALAHKGVEWQFIPKRAPWFGGFWERLIGLTKSTLKKTLGRTHATLESLQTIIVEVEALLNDRPITYASSDIDDLNPITPSHLLHGSRIVKLPHTDVQEDEIHDLDFMIGASEIRHKAKKQALIFKHFETRWKREYLTALREKHRVTGNNYQEIKTGDVVLIHDDTARVNWRMAVIESVNKGADGMIRSANIHTSTGRTNCPVAHLYPLELSEDTTSTPMDGRTEQLTIACDTPVCRSFL